MSSGAIDDNAGGEIAVVEIGIRFAEFGDHLVDLVSKDVADTCGNCWSDQSAFRGQPPASRGRSRISVIEFVTLKATLRYRGDQQSLNNPNAGNFYVMAIDCLFPSAGHADGRFIFRCPVQNVCRMFGFWINLHVFGIFGV